MVHQINGFIVVADFASDIVRFPVARRQIERRPDTDRTFNGWRSKF